MPQPGQQASGARPAVHVIMAVLASLIMTVPVSLAMIVLVVIAGWMMGTGFRSVVVIVYGVMLVTTGTGVRAAHPASMPGLATRARSGRLGLCRRSPLGEEPGRGPGH